MTKEEQEQEEKQEQASGIFMKLMIGKELRRLHITANLKGYHYLVDEIGRVMEDPSLILLITKLLYPVTAKKFGVTAGSVERGIRTAIQICWKHGGKPLLEEMAGFSLTARPSNAVFIDIVSAYIRQAN